MPQTLEERIAVIEHKFAQYEGSHDFLSDQIAGVHRRLIQFEKETGKRFDGLEGRFDNLEGRFDGLEGRFDNLEGRFDGLEKRVDTLESKVDAIVPAIAKIIVEEIAKLKS